MPAVLRPDAAARLLVEALGSVASCVTTQRLAASTSYFIPNEIYEIAFLGPPVSLNAPAGGPSGLFLDVKHYFSVVTVDPQQERTLWRVTTRMYEYRLLDHDGRELLIYHWQPGNEYRGPDHPHLHVSASLNAQITAVDRQSIDLDKLHLATSRVSLASVVRMLITEFRVAPRRHDWAETLDRTEGTLRQEAGQFA